MYIIKGAPYTPPKEDEIMAGDLIQVQLDVDVFKIMQNEEHGGWNDRMAMVGLSVFVVYVTVNYPVAMIVCWSSWES